MGSLTYQGGVGKQHPPFVWEVNSMGMQLLPFLQKYVNQTSLFLYFPRVTKQALRTYYNENFAKIIR